MVTLEDCYIVIPIFASPTRHSRHGENSLSVLYVKPPNEPSEIRTFNHLDNLEAGTLDDLMNVPMITPNKKDLLSVYPFPQVYDASLMWYYLTGNDLDLSDIRINCLDVMYNKHYSIENINEVIPLLKHKEYCDAVAVRIETFYSLLKDDQLTSYIEYNNNAILALYSIERVGVKVDPQVIELFGSKVEKHISENKMYTDYFLCTSAGRPSNSFGGINFAALEPKKRTFIVAQNDYLMECDYDAYHVRILGDLIGYEFPKTSVHEHLRQYYGNVTYDESKAMSFKYLYGTIPPQVGEMNPFFKGVKDLSDLLWTNFNSDGFIETPIYKRRFLKQNYDDMSANKLLNYYIQATETERNIRTILEIQRYLYKKKTILILYNYDSFLFDVHEKENVISDLMEILQKGGFIVKAKSGNNFGDMNEVNI